MSEHDDRAAAIRLTITPEPTDEEAAAIAAVVAVLAASGSAEETKAEPRIDRWGAAGRREALRGPLWRGDGRATMDGQVS